MPAYGTLTIPPGLLPGDSYNVWNDELLTLGVASERVALAVKDGQSATPYKVALIFSGAPGAIQFDVQESSTDDVASDYSVAPNGSITTVDAGTGTTAIYEGTSNNAKWVRIMPRTFANIGSVTVEASVLR